MKQKLISITLLICVIFILGIIIGNNLASSKEAKIEKFLRESELATESYVMEQDFLKDAEEICSGANVRLGALGTELWKLGTLLQSDTAKKDLGDVKYALLKKKYHLLQIKEYILFSKLNRDCSLDGSVILYYFSNNDGSLAQGKILDRLVAENNITVIAVEFGYAEELSFLENYYNITAAPTLIVDFDKKKEGLASYDSLKKILHS